MVLDYGDLNDADKAVIEELRQGRNIPSNIAGNLDYTREYVSSRLKRLREHEIVRNIGGGVHELVEENVPEDIADAGSSEPDQVVEQEPDETWGEPEDDTDVVRDAVADIDFPGTKDREECVGAVRAAYEYLQKNEKATMSEFVTEVMPGHPAGYDAESDVERINDSDKRNRSTWWRKVVKPGLEALPDVESPPTGGSDWTYTGENDE